MGFISHQRSPKFKNKNVSYMIHWAIKIKNRDVYCTFLDITDIIYIKANKLFFIHLIFIQKGGPKLLLILELGTLKKDCFENLMPNVSYMIPVNLSNL